MIPSSYVGFFEAAAQAAGALIGLLFVVVALRPERMVGAKADPVAQKLVGSSFTGLVDAFFVSVLVLIPGNDKGIGVGIMAALSLFQTLRLHLGHRQAQHIVMFVASLLAYGYQLYLAVEFALHPHDADLVNDLSYVMIVAFAVALSRAWQLLRGAAVAPADKSAAPARTPDAAP
jgi:hypothetical protein